MEKRLRRIRGCLATLIGERHGVAGCACSIAHPWADHGELFKRDDGGLVHFSTPHARADELGGAIAWAEQHGLRAVVAEGLVIIEKP